jgi:Sec-independent protein translocase protein TatA
MGTELLIGLALAFVVLGPQRMHPMLGHLGRVKAQFEKASQETH